MRKNLGTIQDLTEKKWITTPEDAFEFIAGLRVENKDRSKLLQSLKVLTNNYNMQFHKDKEQNWLFAKLALYVFDHHLMQYKNGNIALKNIIDALKLPMDYYFDQIELTVNTLEANILDPKQTGKELIDKINLMLNDETLYE